MAAAVLFIAAAAPAAAHYNPKKAIWGPTQVNGKSEFPLYQDLGVSIFQMPLRWDTTAPTRPANPRDPADPAYRWPAEIDYAVGQARSRRMRVALEVIASPAWENGGHADGYWAPLSPSDYADFVRAAARRYPGVHLWMVWGEPNRAANFQPEPGYGSSGGSTLTPELARWPRLYARMLDAAYGALKHISKRNLVIGGNTPSGGNTSTRLWIKYMRLPNGKPPRLDLYGHNPFTAREPNLSNPPLKADVWDFSDLRRLARWLDKDLARSRGRHIRIFLSEWTIPTVPYDKEFPFYVDPPVQARWIRSAFRIVNGWSQIYGLGWIHLFDDPPGGVSFGGLLDAGGHPKPGYFAFKAG